MIKLPQKLKRISYQQEYSERVPEKSTQSIGSQHQTAKSKGNKSSRLSIDQITAKLSRKQSVYPDMASENAVAEAEEAFDEI